MNEPRTYPEGVTCWVDVEEADVEEAARFYGVLFGWTFLEVEPKRHYLVAQLDGQDAAGIGQQPATNDSAADPLAGTPMSPYEISTRQSPAWSRPAAVSRSHGRASPRPPSLHPASTPRKFRFVCGRPGAGLARRLLTLPAHGISVTCIPATRRRPWPSTLACSAGGSTTLASRQ